MATEGTSIPDDIQKALIKGLQDDPEGWSRVVFFINSRTEDRAKPYITSFTCVLDNPVMFKSLAKRLAEDTKKQKKIPQV